MEVINPYVDEGEFQLDIIDEIRAELEALERKKQYLLELLEHYEP